MNSKDIRNLHEAYLDVYSEGLGGARRPLDYDEYNREAREGIAAALSRLKEKLRSKTKADEAQKFLTQHPKKKTTQKEQVDLYDLILSHLLDEGYANCLGSAEIILKNMSDEWIENIMEGNINKKFLNRKYKIGMPDRNIEPDVIDDPETGYPIKKIN